MVHLPDHVYTPAIRELIAEARALLPSRTLDFRPMTDERLLRTSAGSALTTDTVGNATVYYDPQRVTEYALAHELMHAVLHRSGWPQMYAMLRGDAFARRLADAIDNIVDHVIFHPRLFELGVDATEYREAFLAGFKTWPQEEPKGLEVLWRALTIVEAMLMGAPYRDRIPGLLPGRYQHTRLLARDLERALEPARRQSKREARRAMILALGRVAEWLTHNMGGSPHLHRRIGVSPLFARRDLGQPAHQFIALVEGTITVETQTWWTLACRTRDDGVYFRTWHAPIDERRSPEVKNIRWRWKTLTLEEWLAVEQVKFGITTD